MSRILRTSLTVQLLQCNFSHLSNFRYIWLFMTLLTSKTIKRPQCVFLCSPTQWEQHWVCQSAEMSMVAGMSSSYELSLKRQGNAHRTCHTDSTQLNKPVSGGIDSIICHKRTTPPQDLNLAKSCGRRTTGNKPQAANQSLPCLRKSRHQVTNGCVSKNSHQPEQVLPRKIATPKYQLKTAFKGRKKKNVELNEKKVAASKAELDGLDNLCPEQHLSSQKPKRTHYQNSKRTQNHQTPSDVSTGVYTCITLSPCCCKEDSCCHTNRPQSSKQDRLQSSPLLNSTSNSDLKSLSPQTGQNGCAPHSQPDKSSVEKVWVNIIAFLITNLFLNAWINYCSCIF